MLDACSHPENQVAVDNALIVQGHIKAPYRILCETRCLNLDNMTVQLDQNDVQKTFKCETSRQQ